MKSKTAEAGDSACWVCENASTPDPTYGRLGYYRCENCNFLFSPERGREELRALYNDSYFEEYGGDESYKADESARRYEARCRLDHMAQWMTGGDLLELGSATGIFLDQAQQAGFRVVGVEPNASLAEEAARRFSVQVHPGLVEDLKLPDSSFDAVCGWHVLEHITQPQEALTVIRRLLRPKGLLFFEVPNFESAASHIDGPNWSPLDPQHHVSQYGPETLTSLVSGSGFEVLSVDTIAFGAYILPWRVVRNPRNAAFLARCALRTRSRPRRSHPTRHELLRIAARVE